MKKNRKQHIEPLTMNIIWIDDSFLIQIFRYKKTINYSKQQMKIKSVFIEVNLLLGQCKVIYASDMLLLYRLYSEKSFFSFKYFQQTSFISTQMYIFMLVFFFLINYTEGMLYVIWYKLKFYYRNWNIISQALP